MTIDLVFITYNRLEYTKLALASVLADPEEEFSLTIWDNASTNGTVEYLENEVSDPRISDIILSKENVGQTPALNEVWGKSKADLIGKLDNDILVTPGWTRTLAEAHADVPELGIVGCWPFYPNDFDYERAKHKIQRFGRHQVLRHPWTASHSSLVKRKAFRECGPLDPKAGGTTNYWIRLAVKGYINGFYYPLIHVETMDDPRSKYCRVKSMPFEEAFKYTYGVQALKLKNLEQYNQVRDKVVENLLTGPYDPKYYSGWRVKMRRLWGRLRRL